MKVAPKTDWARRPLQRNETWFHLSSIVWPFNCTSIGCNCLEHRRADPILSLISINAQKGSWPGSQAGSSPRVPVLSFSLRHPPLSESISEDQCIPLYQYQPALQTETSESRYHRREQMLGCRAVQQCTSPALQRNFGYHLSTVALGTGMGDQHHQKKNFTLLGSYLMYTHTPSYLKQNSSLKGGGTSNRTVLVYTEVRVPCEQLGLFHSFNQCQMFSQAVNQSF